ncbi:MAG TPA: alpha/beta hydrolase [Jatrophihabitans sp.]|nr:alpha/beta hydrolase [Jatrophihabitans sp.]
MSEPTLDVDTPPGDVQAVALVLHGGRAKGTSPVRPTQLAVLRMAPFAASLLRAGRSHGLAVARLRYLVRGWNGDQRSPVPDVQWALDRLSEWYPERPVALIGHSMGGRAAVYAAGHPAVSAVVGLAPWIERGDPYRQVAGRDVLVAHGSRDRMTSARGSQAWTQVAGEVAKSASYVSINGEGHAMVRRARLWHRLTTSYVLAVLCGIAPSGTDESPAANLVAKVLAGDTALVV